MIFDKGQNLNRKGYRAYYKNLLIQVFKYIARDRNFL
jgi:hypothetical protein